jgi:hypothetical protein
MNSEKNNMTGTPILFYDFTRAPFPLFWNVSGDTESEWTGDGLKIRSAGKSFKLSGLIKTDVSGYSGLDINGRNLPPMSGCEIRDVLGNTWSCPAAISIDAENIRVPFDKMEMTGQVTKIKTPLTAIEEITIAFNESAEEIYITRVQPYGSLGLAGPSVSIAENQPLYENQSWEKTAEDVKQKGFTAVNIIVIAGANPLERQLAQVRAFHEAGIKCVMMYYPTTDLQAYDAHPEWRQRLLGGDSKFDWRVYLCPNAAGYRKHTSVLVRDWLKDVPYDGIIFSEPWFEVWGGPYPKNPTHTHYGCLCDNCVAKYRKIADINARDLFKQESEYYFTKPENKELYKKWMDFRVETVVSFCEEIYEAAEEIRPDIARHWMHLSDCLQQLDIGREYQAMDLDYSVKRLKPKVLVFEDAWQEWTITDLKPDYVLQYGKCYVDRIRAIDPDIIIRSHSDIGSLKEMKRSHEWIRRYATWAHAAGFDSTVYYEYTLPLW